MGGGNPIYVEMAPQWTHSTLKCGTAALQYRSAFERLRGIAWAFGSTRECEDTMKLKLLASVAAAGLFA
ncbi:hypothetical protein ACWQV9_11910, partial [Brevundimonas diminuta]